MPELKNCEYVLIEYAPSPLRDTRLAIGLFLFNDAGRLVRQGFARDWRRVRCLDPQADLTLLENVPGYFEAIRTGIEASLGEQQWTGDFYRQLLRMRQECSGGIQISPEIGRASCRERV